MYSDDSDNTLMPPYTHEDILKAEEIALNDAQVRKAIGERPYSFMSHCFVSLSGPDGPWYPSFNISIANSNNTQIAVAVDLQHGRLLAFETGYTYISEPQIIDYSNGKFVVEINGSYYPISYNFTSSNNTFTNDYSRTHVNSATAYVEAKKLTIAVKSLDDGKLVIHVPRNVLESVYPQNGTESDYRIYVNGKNAMFEEIQDDESSNGTRTLAIDIRSGSDKIEIIGTQMVPEFAESLTIVAVLSMSVAAFASRLDCLNTLFWKGNKHH